MKDISLKMIFNIVKDEKIVAPQALNCELVLKTVHRLIKFSQTAWLKSYIEMNTELRKNSKKIILKKIF